MALSAAKSEHAARKHGGVKTASSKQPRGNVRIEFTRNWKLSGTGRRSLGVMRNPYVFNIVGSVDIMTSTAVPYF